MKMSEIMRRPQAVTDKEVVDGMMMDLEDRMDSSPHSAWSGAYEYATSYIDGLYDEFTPELDDENRRFGRLLGGVALAYADLQYGHSEISPRLASGSVENDVLPTYHHSGHPRAFVRDMFRYSAARPGTYSDDEKALFPISGGLHDIKMYNGRINDERQSALFAVALMHKLGRVAPNDPRPQKVKAAIMATTWDIQRAAQNFQPEDEHPHMQQAGAVADLLPMFDERGPRVSLALGPEMMTMNTYDNILSRVAQEQGFELDGTPVDECLEFIDSHPELGAVFGNFLRGQPGFYRNFEPADPALDQYFPGREANVGFFDEHSQLYVPGRKLGAVATYEAAKAYSNHALQE
jgi:hypothetical protein